MKPTATPSNVLLTYDEFNTLMSIVADWLDDSGPNGPDEFPYTAEQVEDIIAKHGTGSNQRV